MIQAALDFHRQGRLADAERAYRSVLAQDPDQFEALHYLGVLKLQQGRPAEAEPLIARAVKRRPGDVDAARSLCGALMALNRNQDVLAICERIFATAPADIEARFIQGVALMNLQRFEEALACFDRVLAVRPDHVSALFNRGNMMAVQARYADALASYDKALALDPRLLPAIQNRGNALSKLGRHEEALDAHTKALAFVPGNLEAIIGRSISLRELGRYDEALAACDQALAIDHSHPAALISRGNVLLRLARAEEALACFERVLALRPDDVEGLYNRGIALDSIGRTADAVASYDHALAIAPGHAAAFYNRAMALYKLARYAESLASAERALAIAPTHIDALFLIGNALCRLQREQEAIACFEQVLASNSAPPYTAAALAYCCLLVCDWDKLEPVERLLDDAIAAGSAIISPFILIVLSLNAADVLACTRRFVDYTIPMEPKLPPAQPRARRDKIRIAYLSGDFRHHAVAHLVAELFERHDRTRFEVIGISFGPDDGSDIRARIVGALDQFHEVGALNDRDAAKLVQDLGVDIAIDLMGHTGNSRTGILSCRPAPIQVSYLGLLGTMGVDFIDYLLADKLVLPFDQQPFYMEKIVHLPDCFMVGDSRPAVSPHTPSRSEMGLPAQGFVFASFNTSYKFRRPIFAAWMRLLHAVEGSVLWLLALNESGAMNLRREAERHGIDPERLIFAPPIAYSEHLARQRLADLFLDTLPCNAGATAIAALREGLPVLTLLGEGFYGRQAASLLNAVGLPELVTGSLDEYQALAHRLAAEPALLESIRTKLARNRLTHPLFDTDRMRRHIEAAYTTMWEIAQRGESPRSFSVEAQALPRAK
jgi:protein O-GlcNAc transferase